MWISTPSAVLLKPVICGVASGHGEGSTASVGA